MKTGSEGVVAGGRGVAAGVGRGVGAWGRGVDAGLGAEAGVALGVGTVGRGVLTAGVARGVGMIPAEGAAAKERPVPAAAGAPVAPTTGAFIGATVSTPAVVLVPPGTGRRQPC